MAVRNDIHKRILDIIDQKAHEKAQKILEQHRKTAQIRYENDLATRVTIGARVRAADADWYRRAAQRTQRSMYRFVVDALNHEAQRSGAGR